MGCSNVGDNALFSFIYDTLNTEKRLSDTEIGNEGTKKSPSGAT